MTTTRLAYSIWHANARSHGYICGKPQSNYDLNEGIRISNTKKKASFRSISNEITPFKVKSHLQN